MDIAEITKRLQEYNGLQARLFSDYGNPLKDGVITESPRYDPRTQFVLAFMSQIPMHVAGQEEPVGESILYYHLHPEKIKDIELSNNNRIVLIGYSDDKYYVGNGMIYIPKDIDKVRKALGLEPLALKTCPFIRM